MNEPTSPLTLDLSLAMGGPAALGLTLGLTGAAHGWLHPTWTLPAAMLGTTLLMLPALYIGGALAGADATARRVARDTLGALREAGLGCLGLAPAMLFLCATSGEGGGQLAVGLSLALAALLGLRGLYTRLYARLGSGAAKAKATLVFAAWTLVALGIGARLSAPAFS